MKGRLDWRPPQGGIAFLAVCFVLAALYSIVTGGNSWYMRIVGPLFLPLGVGLWFKHAWARWVTFAFFCFVAVLLMLLLYNDGISVRRLVEGLLIAGSIVALWEWRVYPPEHQIE
jgi:hypothetical protein